MFADVGNILQIHNGAARPEPLQLAADQPSGNPTSQLRHTLLPDSHTALPSSIAACGQLQSAATASTQSAPHPNQAAVNQQAQQPNSIQTNDVKAELEFPTGLHGHTYSSTSTPKLATVDYNHNAAQSTGTMHTPLHLNAPSMATAEHSEPTMAQMAHTGVLSSQEEPSVAIQNEAQAAGAAVELVRLPHSQVEAAAAGTCTGTTGSDPVIASAYQEAGDISGTPTAAPCQLDDTVTASNLFFPVSAVGTSGADDTEPPMLSLAESCDASAIAGAAAAADVAPSKPVKALKQTKLSFAGMLQSVLAQETADAADAVTSIPQTASRKPNESSGKRQKALGGTVISRARQKQHFQVQPCEQLQQHISIGDGGGTAAIVPGSDEAVGSDQPPQPSNHSAGPAATHTTEQQEQLMFWPATKRKRSLSYRKPWSSPIKSPAVPVAVATATAADYGTGDIQDAAIVNCKASDPTGITAVADKGSSPFAQRRKTRSRTAKGTNESANHPTAQDTQTAQQHQQPTQQQHQARSPIKVRVKQPGAGKMSSRVEQETGEPHVLPPASSAMRHAAPEAPAAQPCVIVDDPDIQVNMCLEQAPATEHSTIFEIATASRQDQINNHAPSADAVDQFKRLLSGKGSLPTHAGDDADLSVQPDLQTGQAVVSRKQRPITAVKPAAGKGGRKTRQGQQNAVLGPHQHKPPGQLEDVEVLDLCTPSRVACPVGNSLQNTAVPTKQGVAVTMKGAEQQEGMKAVEVTNAVPVGGGGRTRAGRRGKGGGAAAGNAAAAAEGDALIANSAGLPETLQGKNDVEVVKVTGNLQGSAPAPIPEFFMTRDQKRRRKEQEQQQQQDKEVTKQQATDAGEQSQQQQLLSTALPPPAAANAASLHPFFAARPARNTADVDAAAGHADTSAAPITIEGDFAPTPNVGRYLKPPIAPIHVQQTTPDNTGWPSGLSGSDSITFGRAHTHLHLDHDRHGMQAVAVSNNWPLLSGLPDDCRQWLLPSIQQSAVATTAPTHQAQQHPTLMHELAQYLVHQHAAPTGTTDASVLDLPTAAEILPQLQHELEQLKQTAARNTATLGSIVAANIAAAAPSLLPVVQPSGSNLLVQDAGTGRSDSAISSTLQWVDKYAPASGGQMCGNAGPVNSIKQFLSDWESAIQGAGADAAGNTMTGGMGPGSGAGLPAARPRSGWAIESDSESSWFVSSQARGDDSKDSWSADNAGDR